MCVNHNKVNILDLDSDDSDDDLPLLLRAEWQPPEPPKKQVNTSRCFTCNKKIGLLGFKCKCEFVFCAAHRAEDKHSCAFDYKAQGKELLTRLNPVITPKKLEGM